MKKINATFPQTSPLIKVDSRGQRYIVYPNGQMKRLTPNGTPLPRIKLSKKERLKLRREYQEVENLNQKELASKILETPVINPISTPESKDSSVEEPAVEKADA